MRLLPLLVLSSLLLGSPSGADAQQLRYSPPVDLPITLGGAGAWVTSQELRTNLVPDHCRWCDRDASGRDTLNHVDSSFRRLRWRHKHLADALSNMTAFAATPMAAGGLTAISASHDHKSTYIQPDFLLIAEAGVLAADVNQLVKFVAARERPDVHVRMLADPGARRGSVEDDLSFSSGHTTEAVSLAVASGTVAQMRGYRLAPVVWATTLPLALVTGYLRIAADRHYFTDVLVGAVTGAAMGFLIPFVFHQPGPGAASSAGPSSALGNETSLIGVSGVW